MNLRKEMSKLLSLGDREQEDAWGEMIKIGDRMVKGVFSPLEWSYEVEMGGNKMKVSSSLRIRRIALAMLPRVGSKVVAVATGKIYRITQVKDSPADVSLVFELAEV